MSTLQIIKLESGAFKHVDSIDGDFFLGRFSFKQELNKAFLVEAYGAKRREYEINEIYVYDFGGAEELFTNWDDLFNRLTDLGYNGIETNGIIPTASSYISSDVDNSIELGTDNKLFVPVSGGGVQSVVAGTNVTVDNTDPLNPIVSSVGGGSSSQYVRMFIPLFDEYVVAVNTWRSWARNESNILNSKANASLGTGSVPSNLFDCNFFLVKGATTLTEVTFVCNNSYSIKNYEIFIQSFTFVNGTAVASETNIQTLVQQTFATAGSSLYTRVPLTVATNTLGATTGVRVAWRYTGGGSSYITEAPQFLFKFD